MLIAMLTLSGTLAPKAVGQSDCELPEKLLLGPVDGEFLQFEIDRIKSKERQLDELGLWTKGRWALGLLAPGLWAGEIGINLYPWGESRFLTEFSDIDTNKVVKFFAACKLEDSYKTIPVIVSRVRSMDGDIVGTDPNWGGYIGMTIVPDGKKPVVTLEGDLRKFACPGC